MYRSKYPDDPGMHNAGRGGSVLPSAFAKKTDITFVERVSNSFTGSLLGIGLIVVGVFIVVLNEGLAAHVSWKLEEGLRNIIPLESSQVVFAENNNKLVHVTGKLRTTEPLVDTIYGISVQAVKLRRHVQMYQWVEHRRYSEDSDEEVQYTYTKEWRAELIDSDTFENPARHTNKKEFSIQGTTFVAIRAYLGNFQLKEPIKEKIDNFEVHIATQQPTDNRIKLHKGFYYSSVEPTRPMIGDVRVTFSYAGVSGPDNSPLGPANKVSIIAKQTGAMLTSYMDPNGESREMVYMGESSAEEMLLKHLKIKDKLTWSLRIGGWLMIFLGFSFMRLITYYMMDLIPALQKIAAFGLTNFNLCLSFSLAMFFASTQYLMTRPLRALIMMIVALLPFIIVFMRQRLSKKNNLKI
ncbi:transmembrane protein 43-like [Diadema antillarum]|uniref:transmembrane protein 43-like n=1 Tax=Diadema antillarum TaxID=105358 RepID=UPI003A878419